MKKIMAIVALTCITSAAYAETSGLYVNGQLGSSWNQARSIENRFLEDDMKADPNPLTYDSQTKAVFSGGIGIGYDFKPKFNIPVRTELMYTLRGNLNKDTNAVHLNYVDDDDNNLEKNADYYLNIKTRMNTLMINTYYDFDTGTKFTPYVSLGVGAAFMKYERTGLVSGEDGNGETISKSKTNFAYSAGIGASYKISERWSADVVARYTYGGKISVNTQDDSAESKLKLSTTDLMIGVRYSF